MYYYTVESSALGTADRPMDTEAMLRSLGVSGSLIGFDYTVYMVDCMVKNNGYKRTVTKAKYSLPFGKSSAYSKHLCTHNSNGMSSGFSTFAVPKGISSGHLIVV